jgi:hypothetical protein
VYSENHELTNFPDKADKLEEGKELIATVSRLKYSMAHDRVIEYVSSRQCTTLTKADALIGLRRPLPADGEALVDEYNAELARLEECDQNTWFTAPWLYAEYALTTVPTPVA